MVNSVRCVVVVFLTLVLGAAGSVVAASPAAAALTDRRCDARTEGAYKLDYCVRGWVSDDGRHTRTVVEMHTYRYVASAPGEHWVDSTSRSITINAGYLTAIGNYVYGFGNDPGVKNKCRVNGPAGPVACSVANTARVAFYSVEDYSTASLDYKGSVAAVSFRDAEGVPHKWNLPRPYLTAYWSNH